MSENSENQKRTVVSIGKKTYDTLSEIAEKSQASRHVVIDTLLSMTDRTALYEAIEKSQGAKKIAKLTKYANLTPEQIESLLLSMKKDSA